MILLFGKYYEKKLNVSTEALIDRYKYKFIQQRHAFIYLWCDVILRHSEHWRASFERVHPRLRVAAVCPAAASGRGHGCRLQCP